MKTHYASLVLALATLPGSTTAAKPNFVFILADDWGWGDVGAYGAAGDFTQTGTNTRTPTLDALARNGTLLTDFHSHAVCSPSRAAWLTGRFAEDVSFNGVIGVGKTGWQSNPLHGFPYQLPTPTGEDPSPWAGGLLNVGSLMQQRGWQTAHFGKWHVGGCSPPGNHTPYPSEYGFDRTATHASPLDSQCLPSTPTDLNLGVTNKAFFPDAQWHSADLDTVASELTMTFIQNASSAKKPFYVQLWLHMSHATVDPRPEQYADMYPFSLTCQNPRTAAFGAANPGGNGTPGEPCDVQAYYGAQHWTDTRVIKRVIDTVDDLGLRGNTYVLFSTDNGPAGAGIEGYAQPGPAGGGSMLMGSVGVTGPFRGNKLSLYEGGHRLPFIITGPGIARGRVDHSLASSVDWLPTVASLAGAATPPGTTGLRGVDLSPILLLRPQTTDSQLTPLQRPPLFWRGGGGSPPCWNRSPPFAMRDGDWKLLFAPGPASAPPRGRLARGAVQRQLCCTARARRCIFRVDERSQIPPRCSGGNDGCSNGVAQEHAVPVWEPRQQPTGLVHVDRGWRTRLRVVPVPRGTNQDLQRQTLPETGRRRAVRVPAVGRGRPGVRSISCAARGMIMLGQG